MSNQDDSTQRPERVFRVFVDARIGGRDDVSKPKTTLIGYVVKGRDDLRNVTKLENVIQSDEAEMKAVAFCIAELKEKLDEFTILCDNESVVSEIKRGVSRPRSRPVLSVIQQQLKENHPRIKVELLSNPADKLLKQYAAEHDIE